MQLSLEPGEIIRVVVMDDHPLVSQGLKEILEKDKRIQVVGQVAGLADLLSVYEKDSPDVILMDVSMPQMDGIAVTRALLERYPDAAVLVLTSYGDDETVVAAIDAGARGFLLKKAEVNEMINAVVATYQGKRSLSSEALEALIRAKANPKHPDDELTEREMEVLQLMTQGLTNPQIAEELHVTVSTVKFHVGLVLKKLQVSTRTEAVSKAIRNNLTGKHDTRH